MNNKILIVTSGGSQLITQLAVLKNHLNNYENDVFIIYNGVFRESLEQFFIEVATFYKYKYLGQINFDINPSQFEIRNLLTDLISNKFQKLNNFIANKFNILKENRNSDLLIVPVRVKMFSDIVLLSFLKPKKVIYIVDGVVDVFPKRNFNKFKFLYLKGYLKKLPLKSEVFSPSYLKNDCNKIGLYKEVDIFKVAKELSGLKIIDDFKNKFLSTQIDYIIFSQHYSLSEKVTLDNEIEFYKRIIENICGLKCKVLFKPHPRDTEEKIEAIRKSEIGNLLVIDEYFQGVPVELLIDELTTMDPVFITGNSSAPLCFEKNNRIISVFSNELLSVDLNSKIIEFASLNKLKLIEI